MKQKAIEDAKRTQAFIVKECADNGREIPPYTLVELIGKGSFGRVYKAASSSSPQPLFAVKIISIEQGDINQPGLADTFSDILKEVKTLKLLKDSGAKNINNVVEILLVGQTVWMVTQYCAGGSVSSLMRPTGGRGLQEKWVIPILREVAEAIFWVHQQGIIHRDIKCANVLITEAGHVQLCDFGVAGLIESKLDKRSTATGTIQWMAPELFDPTVSYGIEINIWAFGAMVYEIASGLPPNALKLIDADDFGSYLKENCPRLEGDRYSSRLKELVAFCMVASPSERPSIEEIQRHPYLFETAGDYPTESLSKLVQGYRVWESYGGSRQSLFTAGGAQGLDFEVQSLEDNGWNFETVEESDLMTVPDQEVAKVQKAYDASINIPATEKPQRRRRQPPKIRELIVPLQKVFNSNTVSKYEDNSRIFYGKPGSAGDLSLRDDSEELTIRESFPKSNISVEHDGSAATVNMDTIKYGPRSSNAIPLSRPRTQDWTFPTTGTASASLDGSFLRTSATSLIGRDQSLYEMSTDHIATDSRPFNSTHASTDSLIDLDASLVFEVTGPSISPNATHTDPASGGSSFSADIYLTSHDNRPSVDDSTVFPGATTRIDSFAPVRMDSLAIPDPPSCSVVSGTAPADEIKTELERLILSFSEHLQASKGLMEDLSISKTNHLSDDSE